LSLHYCLEFLYAQANCIFVIALLSRIPVLALYVA
jgi:hypothetical protein